jgi:hypothetical protein
MQKPLTPSTFGEFMFTYYALWGEGEPKKRRMSQASREKTDWNKKKERKDNLEMKTKIDQQVDQMYVSMRNQMNIHF